MIEVTAANAAEVAAKLAEKKAAGERIGVAKSLAEAMAKVMEHVGYVQKTGTMEFGQKYRYAGEAAFIAAIRPELVAQGIVVAPVGMELLAAETVKSAKGGDQNRVLLRVTWRFTHAPSGDCLDVVTCGEGIDMGDKATNKAMTGAMKYALRQAFVIETGNDPDDTPSHTQERAVEKPAAVQPEKPNNPALRAKYAAKFAQCKDRAEYLATCKGVGEDVKAGVLTQVDRDALAGIARETAARFHETAKA